MGDHQLLEFLPGGSAGQLELRQLSAFVAVVELGWVLSRFALVSAVLLAAAVLLFRRRFQQGVRL